LIYLHNPTNVVPQKTSLINYKKISSSSRIANSNVHVSKINNWKHRRSPLSTVSVYTSTSNIVVLKPIKNRLELHRKFLCELIDTVTSKSFGGTKARFTIIIWAARLRSIRQHYNDVTVTIGLTNISIFCLYLLSTIWPYECHLRQNYHNCTLGNVAMQKAGTQLYTDRRRCSVGPVTLVLLSLKSSVDVSVTRGGGRVAWRPPMRRLRAELACTTTSPSSTYTVGDAPR